MSIVRFSLEVLGIAIAIYFGMTWDGTAFQKIIITLEILVVIIGLWSQFIAPKSPYLLNGALKFIVENLILFIPCILLLFIKRPTLAVIWECMVLLNSCYFFIR